MIKFSLFIFIAVTFNERLLGMVEDGGLDKCRGDLFLV
jgi:hypothetical protein